MRYLTNVEGGSSKFWEGRVEGASLVVRFGKLGTDGQTKSKALGSAAKAEAELAKVAAEKLRKGYVEGASEKAKPSAAKAKTARAKASFPFLFFGRRPGDWASGANMGHAYELRFQKAPTAKSRAAIAATFEAALADGPVSTSDAETPWRWAGSWALFFVGERGGDEDAFFDAMAKALESIHGVAPLAEVVFAGVRERGESDWDAWSYAQQPGPSANPHFSGHVRVPCDDADGPASSEAGLDGAPDAVFEAARQKARAKAGGAPAKGAAKGKPTLVAIAAEAFPADAEVPAKMASLFAPGTPVTVLPVAGGILALGVKPKSLGQESVLLFAASASDKPRALKLAKGKYAFLAIAPGGDRAVVVEMQKGALYEVSLPGGAAVEVFTDSVPAAARGAGYVDADHIAYLTDDGLVLLERAGAALKETARLKSDKLSGLATAHGAIILAGQDGKLRVLSPAAGKLKERATLITSARVLVGDAGRVYVTDHRFPNRRTTYFELVGLA